MKRFLFAVLAIIGASEASAQDKVSFGYVTELTQVKPIQRKFRLEQSFYAELAADGTVSIVHSESAQRPRRKRNQQRLDAVGSNVSSSRLRASDASSGVRAVNNRTARWVKDYPDHVVSITITFSATSCRVSFSSTLKPGFKSFKGTNPENEYTSDRMVGQRCERMN